MGPARVAMFSSSVATVGAVVYPDTDIVWAWTADDVSAVSGPQGALSRWLVDALDDEDVVRRARHVRHLFTKAHTPGTGPVG